MTYRIIYCTYLRLTKILIYYVFLLNHINQEVFVEKRHAIIESATRLFGSIGFNATSTLEIADEADVTEPLIYYHFKGKHELFKP